MIRHNLCHTLLAIAIAGVASSSLAASFDRIATFATADNLPIGGDMKHETSAEIITASGDGNTLIYSDSPRGGVGFIDIRDSYDPKAGGFIALNGEPTSVSAYNNLVVAGVNTSESYVAPSGYLAAIDLDSRQVMSRCDLGGQPDSVAISRDGQFVAVAVENERDEELNDGLLPQAPAGYLSILPIVNGQVQCDKLRRVDVSGLARIAPEDPEPEFVAFNDNNELALTLQENNHLVIVDAESGRIINHFSAGTVDLDGIDTEKDGALLFTGSQNGVLREPDAVKWLDNERFVIANEGDYRGGARGFTIFHKDGRVLFESGATFEHQVAMAGHYPDKRSGKKGAEPEGLEVARFNGETYIFLLSERGSVIGVYRDTGAAPQFVQLLPSGIAPESAVAIPARNLLVSANEKDLVEDGGVRAHVNLYRLDDEAPLYPQIVSSVDSEGRPLGWGALSGLTADPQKPALLYAVNDSFYNSQPRIFTIDASVQPARIISAINVTRDGKAAKALDLEGIASDGKGGFWLASEGRTDKEIPHAIYHVDANGEIDRTLPFPAELLNNETRFGAEGVALIGDELWIAIQREWKDDPKHSVKLVCYNLKQDKWGAVRYPIETPEQGWVGLSEISAYGDAVYIIERDNQIGENARIKRLYKVAKSELKPAPLGSKLPVVHKQQVRDFIPDLKADNGYVVDKIEGFTIDNRGIGYAVTDNDGVDDSSGETYFFSTGKM
ncbi:alkaline phosphatase [Marinobacterium zhoushanense]|uniref:Alkaline phosphatase n=1 Tax=Marinobacterium zhoushanense TaxID=1679163 RepID=A0ABQ1KKD0_9GAMM|nr:esterase-like activity of phytase family protein [Marinobacterium zhoushanense]GGC01859.1 alkaline phosphatase [Marinobacterium zhoushanense]